MFEASKFKVLEENQVNDAQRFGFGIKLVGKGEIAGILFFSCSILTHSHTMTPFDMSGKEAF